MGETDLVVIDTFATLMEADLARLWLEEEGIVVFLQDQYIAQCNWLWSGMAQGIKIAVPASQAQKAREVLQAHRPTISLSAEGEPFGDAPGQEADELDGLGELDDEEQRPGACKCLRCGQEIPANSDVCPACGWSYGDSEGGEEDQEAAK